MLSEYRKIHHSICQWMRRNIYLTRWKSFEWNLNWNSLDKFWGRYLAVWDQLTKLLKAIPKLWYRKSVSMRFIFFYRISFSLSLSGFSSFTNTAPSISFPVCFVYVYVCSNGTYVKNQLNHFTSFLCGFGFWHVLYSVHWLVSCVKSVRI